MTAPTHTYPKLQQRRQPTITKGMSTNEKTLEFCGGNSYMHEYIHRPNSATTGPSGTAALLNILRPRRYSHLQSKCPRPGRSSATFGRVSTQ